MNRVVQDKMILPLLIKVLSLPNIEVKKNALRCILTFGVNTDFQLKTLNENKILQYLIPLLKTKDELLLEMTLNCIYRLAYNCI